MKDTRFTDLINLYIDRQISPAETAELEAEIRANPRHRQVYLQYCRMHHATKLVYESFRAHADQQPGAMRQPGTIEHFHRRKRANQRARWLYAAGGLAAAACLALVLMRPGTVPSSSANVALTQPTPVATVAAAPIKVESAAAVQAGTPAVFAVNIAAREEPDYAAMLTALRREDQRTFAVSLNASLFDDGVFATKQTLPAGSHRIAPNKKSENKASAEFTAFQFQR